MSNTQEDFESQAEPLVSADVDERSGRVLKRTGLCLLLPVATLCVAGGFSRITQGKTSALANVNQVIMTDSECSDDGHSCKESKCCKNLESTCFRKNPHWESCNKTCTSNWLWQDGAWTEQPEENKHWDCVAVGCTPDGGNCFDTRCCQQPDSKCYKKHGHWASCNNTCSPKRKWDSDSNKWVDTEEDTWDCTHLQECSWGGASCQESKCCKAEGEKCYKKNDWWASCNATCNKNAMWTDQGWVTSPSEVWDCEELTHQGDGDNGDGGSDKAPEEVAYELCIKTEEIPCQGCEGDACSFCNWDARIKCCVTKACFGCSGEQCSDCEKDGEKTKQCCADEDVPSEYHRCAADGQDPDDEAEAEYIKCRADEDQVCEGCQNGEQCSNCDMEGRFRCCLNKQCHGKEGDERTSCKTDSKSKCCTDEALPSDHWMCSA